MLTGGAIVFFGFLFLFIKLPRRWQLKLLGRGLAVDIVVSVVAYALHWGTFTGVMVAAVACMLVSIFTSAARKLIGYIDSQGKYHAGIWSSE